MCGSGGWSSSRPTTRTSSTTLCEKLLANPLIEDFEIETIESDLGVVQFPGSCDERDALRPAGAVGEARLVWHERHRPRRRRRGGRPRRLLLRRLPAGRRDRPLLAGDGGGGAVRRRAAGRCWGSATASRCSARRACCPGRCCPTRAALRLPPGRAGRRERPLGRSRPGCRPGERLSIPVKHASGRYFAPDELLDELEARGQIAFRYAPGAEPERLGPRHRRGHQRGRQRARPDAASRARGRSR